MKLKRLISSVLSAALLTVNCGTAAVFAQKQQEDVYTDKEIAEYNDNVGLLKAVGIIDKDAEYNISDTLTRGEMVKSVMQLFQIPPADVSSESPYSDISEETPEYGYIIAATQRGIVNGDGGMFRPNDNVLYEEASKIVVSMLGYGFLAEEDGGYPQGYLRQATKLDIVSSSVGYNSYPINHFGFAKMLVESLKTDMMLVSFDDYGRKSYKIEPDTNILNSIFKINTIKGVVTRNIYTALDESKSVYDKAVAIDGVLYQTDCDTKNLIGCKVKAYVNSDDEIVHIENRDKYNNILTLDADDAEYGNFSYKYDENNKTKTAKINSKFNFIYNNKAKSNFDSSEMVPKNGYIELIDADKDEVYETVKVYSYRYMMVNRVDASKESVYAKYDGDSLDLEKAEIVEIKDENGKDKDYTELSEYSILKILESADGEVILAEVSANKAKGKISKVRREGSKTIISVGDASYEMINNFIGDTPEAGKNGVVYISSDNKAAAFISGNPSGTKLGILLGAYEPKGDAENLIFKIFSEDGEMVRIDGTDKVSVDGEGRKTAAALKTILCKGGSEIPAQPIFYTVNAQGKVSAIDTAYNIKATDPVDDPLSVPVPSGETASSMRRIYKGSAMYYGTLATFNGKLNLSDSTKVFSIPADYANANDEDFRVGGSSSLSNTTTYTFDAYSTSEADVIADVVITSAGVSASMVYAVVRDVTEEYDESYGEVRTKLTLTSWNRTYEIYTDKPEKVKSAPSINSEDTNTYEISIGDFVAFSRTGNDKLDTIKLVVDASEAAADRYKGAANPTAASINDKDRMVYGKVETNYKSILSINTGSVTENWNVKSFRIYKYEEGRDGGKLESISSSAVYDAKDFGSDANYVLVYSDWAEPRIMIVY